MGVTGAALEAPFLPLALLDGEDVAEPGLVDDLVAAGDQSEQAEGFESWFDIGGIEVGHGFVSFLSES